MSKSLYNIERLSTEHKAMEEALASCPKGDWVKAQEIKKKKLAAKDKLNQLKKEQLELQMA